MHIRARTGIWGAIVVGLASVTASSLLTIAPSTSPAPLPSADALPIPPIGPFPTNPGPTAAPGLDTSFYSIDDPTSLWIVVNKARPLNPIDYVPPDLAVLSPIPGGGSQRLRAEAADALKVLYSAAKAAGVPFSIGTAYRSYGDQRVIYHGWVRKNGRWYADKSSARAGYSEHQTGWAVDIYDTEKCRLEYCFGRSALGLWVADHAWEYGFVIRYPKGMEAITGFVWEPWHLRYVGVDLSTEMHTTGVSTLEEVFGLPAAPTY